MKMLKPDDNDIVLPETKLPAYDIIFNGGEAELPEELKSSFGKEPVFLRVGEGGFHILYVLPDRRHCKRKYLHLPEKYSSMFEGSATVLDFSNSLKRLEIWKKEDWENYQAETDFEALAADSPV